MPYENPDLEKEAECPYCGKIFDNSIEEGIHRTNQHIKREQEIGKKSKGDNIVDKWKKGSKA